MTTEAVIDSPVGSRSEAASFRQDIKGLRGVAILAVVLYHVGTPGLFQGGFAGVDVFFVLSGYLITGLLINEFRSNGRVQLLRFSARRIRRLLPASAVVLLATLIMAMLIYSPLELITLGRTSQAVAAYVSNMFFGFQATNYLRGESSSNPFLQTWSLAVEEQFYLVWPVTLALLMWFGRRWLSARKVVAAGMMVVAAASFALSLVLMSSRQNWAFFAAPPRFWEFALGGLAAMIPVTLIRSRNASTGLGVLGFALIGFAIVTFNEGTNFPGATALVPVVGTALVLISGASDGFSLPARLLSGQIIGWFGQISYSWYLWHWPMLVMADLLWPSLGSWKLLVAALSLIPSVMSFHLVEQRVRYSHWLAARTGPTIAGGLAVTLFCFGAATFVRSNAEARSESPEQQLFLEASKDTPHVFDDSCIADFLEVKTTPICDWGAAETGREIVLFGDSHAGHWAPAMSLVAEKHGYRLIHLTKPACPYAEVEPFNDKLRRRYNECSQWRAWALDQIRRINPAYVIISSARNYLPTLDGPSASKVTLSDWRRGIRATLETLSDAQIPFFVISDVPEPGLDVPSCLSRADGAIIGAPDCSFDRKSAHADAGQIERDEVAASGGRLLDFTEAICPTERCEPVRDGMVLYSDQDHLTDTFSRSLAPLLDDQLGL